MTKPLRLATIAQDHWELSNGVLMNAKHPKTFEIPDAAECQALKPGDIVKLVFELAHPKGAGPACCAERMWVQITDIVEPYLIGRLSNHPLDVDAWHDLRYGSQVVFRREHVIDITWPVREYRATAFEVEMEHV